MEFETFQDYNIWRRTIVSNHASNLIFFDNHIECKDLPVDGRNTRYIILRADALGKETIANLPRKHCWVFTLVIRNGIHYKWSGHFRFTSSYHTCFEAPRLVIPERAIGTFNQMNK